MRLRRGSAAKLIRNSALAWVVLIATVVMTVFTWIVTKNYAEDKAEQDFLEIVGEANDAI